ncbi:MAG: hypothetical protein Q7S40_19610 [Opitutaceae bacterium]|nr:hypothetical protein [Opitutaceae bacterium]
MKYNRFVIAAIITAIAVPFTFAAKGERKKKTDTVAFATADKDGNSWLSKTEYAAAVKGTLDKEAADAKFSDLDKDKDGKLTEQEYNAASGGKKGRKKKGTT